MELKVIKRAEDLMLLLGLNKTIDHLSNVNSVHWYGHVLMNKDGGVLRALDFEVEGQRK